MNCIERVLMTQQLFIKQAYILDIFVHQIQIVHMECFRHKESNLQNFEKLYECRKLEWKSIKFIDDKKAFQ